MQVPNGSQVVSVGSFFIRLPKFVAPWPTAGTSSRAPSAASAAVVRRILSFDIFGPFGIGAATR